MTQAPFVAVIGGSGLYEMEGFEARTEHHLDTPFGPPSDAIVEGLLEGTRLAFLPRHGRGHRYSPTEVPYRANLWALKSLGVDRVVSVSAVGSLKQEIPPGDLVVVDQFIDRTTSRPRSFFGEGLVAHVSLADPVCPALSGALRGALDAEGLRYHPRGTYVCIEGPQFSTRAESHLFRSWGCDVIGMTNLPEARLAREAELPYATLALATDYDCWHESEEAVTVEMVVATLLSNVDKAKRAIRRLAALTAQGAYSLEASPAPRALDHALMTHAPVPEATLARLAPLLARVHGKVHP